MKYFLVKMSNAHVIINVTFILQIYENNNFHHSGSYYKSISLSKNKISLAVY